MSAVLSLGYVGQLPSRPGGDSGSRAQTGALETPRKVFCVSHGYFARWLLVSFFLLFIKLTVRASQTWQLPCLCLPSFHRSNNSAEQTEPDSFFSLQLRWVQLSSLR